MIAPAAYGFRLVSATTGLTAATCLLGGGSAGEAAGFGASAIGVGLLMVLMRDLRVRNTELTEARAELARNAVAQERERFARDLHDLLGHTLSVIALKAELAGKLIAAQPEQAAREVGEVETVARRALGEVRLAVSGYRQPTLDDELAGARMALSAAGIEAEVDRPGVVLEPDVEAVLAWAVREAATNVIRHSGARHCKFRVSAHLDVAGIEVSDDGRGCALKAEADNGQGGGAVNGSAQPSSANGHGNGQSGNGLAGLKERAEVLRGRLEAGSLPEGGFRLAISIPTSAARR